jgi:ureidoacrylate peracid hydrolase
MRIPAGPVQAATACGGIRQLEVRTDAAVCDPLRMTPAPLVVEALPEPFPLDPRTAAVLVIDMQNDFGAPGGMFGRAGIPLPAIQAAVAPIARLLPAARRAGLSVVYVTMQFAPDLSDAGAPDAPNYVKHVPLGLGDGHTLIAGSWGAQILPELAPVEGDLIVAKHRYSGFFETELDAALRARGIGTLLFTGCTTSVCVDATLRDAFYRDYRCLLLADCTGEPLGGAEARTNHEATLLTIQTLFGWVSDSATLLEALGEGAPETAALVES